MIITQALTLASVLATRADQSGGRWFANPVIAQTYWQSVGETLAMTGLSSLATVVLGLPLGLLLVATRKDGLLPNRGVHHALALIVNIGRSIPFIILIIAILPITRLIAGSTLGWKAAVVPLTIGAIPFFARLVETAILGVEAGKIEAAHMMGARRWQIMMGVQVREALPALIQSITVLVITLVAYSAMAGTIGGGGLGQLAMNYGYQRYQDDVMILAVVGILIIVQTIQAIGDMCSRLVDHR